MLLNNIKLLLGCESAFLSSFSNYGEIKVLPACSSAYNIAAPDCKRSEVLHAPHIKILYHK